jgi:formylglycine-generating enzyme required for sulfatase activity
MPSTSIAKSDLKKIQALLKSQQPDSVALGLFLLESLGATTADYEALFSPTVVTSVLRSWSPEVWESVARSLQPHGRLCDDFQKAADAWYMKHVVNKRLSPRGLGVIPLHNHFNGQLRVYLPTARVAFLAKHREQSNQPPQMIDLAEIQVGTFMMGRPDWKPGEAIDRRGGPRVEVRITKPYSISRTVVTRGQWKEIMGSQPWHYDRQPTCHRNVRCEDNLPALFVSWDDARLFCETLTSLEREIGRLSCGQSYRLPTEAEWEYACRAGTTTRYSFGDDARLLGDYGWYGANSESRPHEVAEKKPNPWGLFDMHGNVWEWCEDTHINGRLAGGNDPCCATDSPHHVIRGGSYMLDESLCSSASRDGSRFPSDIAASIIGFRVVLAGSSSNEMR